MISLFGGTGFLGRTFTRDSTLPWKLIPRESDEAESREILWLISTTHNYHVFSNPLLDAETNIIRMLQTLRTLKPGSTFNLISSWFVYGSCPLPASETMPCDPRGFYSITKRCAEQLLVSYCTTHGISWRILRLANLYGPDDRGAGPMKNALTHMIGELAANRDISLYWGGDSYRDYLHVTDAVSAIDKVLRSCPLNTVINVGSGRAYRFGNLMSLARNLLGSHSQILSREPSSFHEQVQVRNFWMNVDKIKALGFAPKVSIEKGLEELCAYVRHNHNIQSAAPSSVMP